MYSQLLFIAGILYFFTAKFPDPTDGSPDGDFRVFASFVIISMNISFTVYVFNVYLSEYLKEHEYFRDKIPTRVFTFCSKVSKFLSNTKKKLWKCCTSVKFNRMFNRGDQINESEEWVRIFDYDLGQFVHWPFLNMFHRSSFDVVEGNHLYIIDRQIEQKKESINLPR